MKSRLILGFTTIALCLILMTCGDDTPSAPETDPPEDPDGTSREIGPDGGEITSDDGNLTLTFPEGALSQTETITIEPVSEEELGSEFDEIVELLGVGNAYELGPDGLQFDQPVNVRLASRQEPVQNGDTLGVFTEFLFTSANGAVEVPDSLRTQVDTGEGSVTVHGQLDHFTLIMNGSADQVNNGVQFFINQIPEMLEEDESFTANAVIADADTGPQGEIVTVTGPAVYEDESSAPIAPTFDGAPAGEMDQVPNLPGSFEGDFSYTCTGVGLGVFGNEMSAEVQFDFESGLVTAESRANFITTVECVEAMPEMVPLTVQKDGDGSGTVVSQPDGISCGTDCEQQQADFEEESTVILAAEPAEGSVFSGWSGDTGDASTQDSTLTVIMDSARTVTATFNQAEEAAVSINSFDVVGSTGLDVTVDWNIQINSDGDPGDIGLEIDFGDETTFMPSSPGEQVDDNPPTFWGQATHTYEYAGEYDIGFRLSYKEELIGEAGIAEFVTPAAPEITGINGELINLRTIDFEYQANWIGSTTALNATFNGNSDGENAMDVPLKPGSEPGTIIGNVEYEFAPGLSFPLTSTFEITNNESGESNSEASVEIEEVNLTVEKEGEGTVTGDVVGIGSAEIINCGSDCEEEFLAANKVNMSGESLLVGFPVFLTATPADGYVFTGWSGDTNDGNSQTLCEGTGDCEIFMNQDRTITATFEKEGDEEPKNVVSLDNQPTSMFMLHPESFADPTGDNYRLGVTYRSDDIGSTELDVYSGGLNLRAKFEISGTFTADAEALEISDGDQVKDAVVIGGISGSQVKYRIRGSDSNMLETQTLVPRFTDNVPAVDVAPGRETNPMITAVPFESGLVEQFSYNSGNQQYEVVSDLTVTRDDVGGEDFFDVAMPSSGFTEAGDTFAAVTSDGNNGSIYKFTLEGEPDNVTIVSERQESLSEYVTGFPLSINCAGWDSDGNSICAVTNNNGSGALFEYSLSESFSLITEFPAGILANQPALKRIDDDVVMFVLPDRTTDRFRIGTVRNGSTDYERMDAPADCEGPAHAIFGPETDTGQIQLYLGCSQSENIYRMEVDYDFTD